MDTGRVGYWQDIILNLVELKLHLGNMFYWLMISLISVIIAYNIIHFKYGLKFVW